MSAIIEGCGEVPSVDIAKSKNENSRLAEGKIGGEQEDLAFSFAGMKPAAIIEVYRNRIRKISRHYHNLLDGFDPNAIHHFRVEMKKLRAFMRLVNTASPNRQKIPGEIKSFYQLTGNIRNLQLHQKRIIDLCQHLFTTIPVFYLQCLQKEEKNISRQAALAAIKVHWENFEKKLIKEVPSELSQEDRQAFMQKSKTKLRKFSKLVADDEILHKVRKLLKDLLYNYRFLKFSSPGNYKTMETLTHDLGEHHDLCISLSFSGSVDDQPVEQDILDELRQQWQLSKEELGKENICRLNVQVFSDI